jgi:methionyl-tRNA synthetase
VSVVTEQKNLLITTPIYYVNGSPHIGHAYTSIVCDFLTRFYRQQGIKTFFLTGTDEHGQKVAQSAEKEGADPLTFCDRNSAQFRDLADRLHVQYDDFIRTTEPRHKEFVIKIWKKFDERGWIYKGTYNGWYSVRDEAFYDESEIKDGKAPSGSPVEWKEEESYFFKLSAFTDALLAWYEKYPDFVSPSGRFNELKAFVKGGLTDLSVSRCTFSWGIPIPDTNHVIYVWLDALFNYQSALDTPEKFEAFWTNSKVMHVMGKDIMRFHAVYWPAFLAALECTPETVSVAALETACSSMSVVTHGWWLSEGEKMSKSLGNTIDPYELIEKYGADYVRYFLLREPSFGFDGNFTKEGFINRITGELINNIGNLCQRTFTLTHKNCGSIVPNVKVSHPLLEQDPRQEMLTLMKEYKINQAIEAVLLYASKANEFVQESKPWALFKAGEQAKGEEVMYILLSAIFTIKEAIGPVLPEFHAKISEVFGNQSFAAGIKLNPLPKVFEQVAA